MDVLPVDPVTPITLALRSLRQPVARLCRDFSGSSAARMTPVVFGFPGVFGVLGGRQHAPGAGGQGLRGEAAAVGVLAPEADEQGAGAGVTGVDRDVLGPVGGRRPGYERSAGGCGDSLRIPSLHLARAAASGTSRAIRRSSNRIATGDYLAPRRAGATGAQRPTATPLNASCATVTSSNGTFRPPSNS